MRLRAPELHELPFLSELCLRSKAVWGYDQAFLDACRTELTIRAEELASRTLCVAEHDGALVGVAQITVAGDTADLQKLFVEPAAIRLGVGRLLFGWAMQTARGLGARRLMIEADPGATGFYRKMGAVECGSVASGSIPGRTLPVLQIALIAPATTTA
jgi:GNAT superfamily N-acetyltransferase